MTRKETLAVIRAYFADSTEVTPDQVKEILGYCDKESAAIDKKNSQAKAKRVKNPASNDALSTSIKEILDVNPMTAADIAAQVGTSTNKVAARLRNMVESGLVVKTDVKVNKKKTSAYSLA